MQAYWELDYAWNSVNVQAEAVNWRSGSTTATGGRPSRVSWRPSTWWRRRRRPPIFSRACLLAQQALTAAENNLKPLMLPNRRDLMWGAALIPETPLDLNVAIPSLEEQSKRPWRSAPKWPRPRWPSTSMR